MKILIPGGAGFIGSNLTQRLAQLGHEISILDNADGGKMHENFLGTAAKLDGVSVVRADIRDKAAVGKIFSGGYDAVINLAAKSVARDTSGLEEFVDVNVNGMINLLEAARKTGVKKFVFPSSSSVYGGSDKEKFSEDDDTSNPVSPYGATKKAGETLCRLYSNIYGIDTSVLRLFTVYGPRGRLNMAVMNFIKRIGEGETLEVHGNGTISKDFVYVDDIVDAIIISLKTSTRNPVNIGTGESNDLHSIIRIIEETMGAKAKISYTRMQDGDVPATRADNEMVKKLFGWEPKTKITDGIKKTIDWWLAGGRTLY